MIIGRGTPAPDRVREQELYSHLDNVLRVAWMSSAASFVYFGFHETEAYRRGFRAAELGLDGRGLIQPSQLKRQCGQDVYLYPQTPGIPFVHARQFALAAASPENAL